METRQRGARQRETESRGSAARELDTTLDTRTMAAQHTSAAASGTSSTSRVSLVDSASNHSKRGSLSRDAIARRGAKVSKAASVASIPFTIRNESDGEEDEDEDGEDEDGEDEDGEDEDGEDEDGEDEDGEDEELPDMIPSSQNNHGSEGEGDEGEKQQVMLAGLPDLARAADELMNRLSNEDSGDKNFNAILTVKKRAFVHHRAPCLQADVPEVPAPFLDWARLENREGPMEEMQSAARVFARANLVSALDYIQDTRAGGAGTLELLKALDTVVPALFTPPGRDGPPRGLVLGVRACYAIESLAKSSSRADLRRIIASIFCEPTDAVDFDQLITHGPFRSLGHPQRDEDSDLCSSTAYELYKGGRSKLGMEPLRELFPLDEVLDELEKWIRNEYTSLPESDHHDADEYSEETTSASDPESQPIIRTGDSDEM